VKTCQVRARPPNLRHGFYAAPPYLIRTADDLRRWLTKIQARLSALLDELPTGTPAEVNHWANLYRLYSRNLTNLTRLLRDCWQARADAQAAQALIDSAMEILGEEALDGAAKRLYTGRRDVSARCARLNMTVRRLCNSPALALALFAHSPGQGYTVFCTLRSLDRSERHRLSARLPGAQRPNHEVPDAQSKPQQPLHH